MGKTLHTQYMSDIDEYGNPVYSNVNSHSSDQASEVRLQNMTNEANLALAKYQNLWNQQQWERENEYNTPAAKRQRLLEAGMNPVFYNLEGVANANQLTSANMANSQSPTLTPYSQTWANMMSGMNAGLGTSIDAMKLAVESKKAEAEIQKLHSSSDVDRAQASNLRKDTDLKTEQIANLQTQQDLNKSMTRINVQKVQNLIAEQGETNAKKALADMQKQCLEKTTDKQIELWSSQIGLNTEQTRKIQEEVTKLYLEEDLLRGNVDGVDLDNFSKRIENKYKEMGKEQEYARNNAEILKTCYGMLTPAVIMTYDMRGLGAEGGAYKATQPRAYSGKAFDPNNNPSLK